MIIVSCVLGTIFVLQNSQQVTFQLLVGSPIAIPLIFLMLIFFFLGFVLAFLLGLRSEARLKKQVKELKFALGVPEEKKESITEPQQE